MPTITIPIIKPNWPAPENIQAFSTTRQGGVSTGAYESFNLSTYVGDNLQHVLENRKILKRSIRCQTPNTALEPLWLEQQHGTLVVDADNPETLFADGSYTNQKNIICSIFTADCLPILLCDKSGTEVAAIHAGWRGLLNGVIESGVRKFKSHPATIMAWLGPAIGPNKFEVGPEVQKAFVNKDNQAKSCFKQNRSNHFLADIYKLATLRLQKSGITDIYGGSYCTFSSTERFFSYRRDGKCGRMANLIWIK